MMAPLLIDKSKGFHLLAGGGGDGGGGEDFVHGAGAVALGVEGDVEEAEGLEGGGDAVEGVE